MGKTIGFGKRPDGPEGRRKAGREPMDIPASLLSMEQSRVVHLVDLSAIGAKILGLGLPAEGQEVLLKVADVEILGRIVRVSHGEAGIAFDNPIAEATIEQLEAIRIEQLKEGPQNLR